MTIIQLKSISMMLVVVLIILVPATAYPERMSCDTVGWMPGETFDHMGISELSSASADVDGISANSECLITITTPNFIKCGDELSISVTSARNALGMKVASSGGGDLLAVSSSIIRHENDQCFETGGSGTVVSDS